MKAGKLLLWNASNEESDLHEIKLDQKDWEILKDVLEAHQEYLEDLENDGMLGDDDELFRINHMVEFINKVEED